MKQMNGWIDAEERMPSGSNFYVMNYSIKNSPVYGEKNGFIDCVRIDDNGDYYFMDDSPILNGDEEIVVKYWIPVPELPRETFLKPKKRKLIDAYLLEVMLRSRKYNGEGEYYNGAEDERNSILELINEMPAVEC